MPTTTELAERPPFIPVRSRTRSQSASAAVDDAVRHIAYVVSSLNSAGDSILDELQLGCLESVLQDYLEPAMKALIRLRPELDELAEIHHS